jgi:hypothetical protein
MNNWVRDATGTETVREKRSMSDDIVARARNYVALNAAESGADVLLLDMADEIERLRAALQEIVAIEDSYEGCDWDEINAARDLARRALTEGKE